MNRIIYLDRLKGFAILLVVMGHVIEKGLGITQTAANFYGTFHMPLFMFLSGIFALSHFEKWDKKEIYIYIKKKTTRLLIPFITFGLLLSLIMYHRPLVVIKGEEIAPLWFLPALFYCMFYEMVISLFLNRILHRYSLLLDVFTHLLLWIILSIIYYKCNITIPYYLHFIKMYLFFYFGTLYSKYTVINDYISNNNIIYTICIICYIIFAIIQYNYSLPICLAGFFAIIVLIQFFLNLERVKLQLLEKIGKFSMQIYVLHWFFIPTLLPLGNSIISMGGENDEVLNNWNFIIVISVSVTIASLIIGLCIITDYFIKKSKLLNIILWGGY